MTEPWRQVQRWQGLPAGEKECLWGWTTPSYRQESHPGQQLSPGTGWEHWDGQDLRWQLTTSFRHVQMEQGSWAGLKEEPD